VALNLVSVGATYGVLVLVWQHGRGSHAIWGLPATGAITNWVPLIAFAFLYGLSMDPRCSSSAASAKNTTAPAGPGQDQTPDRIHAGQGLSSLMVAGDGFEPSQAEPTVYRPLAPAPQERPLIRYKVLAIK
jgi:hypothetical protein